ncbi:family 20 glycosylhydrolase [Luteimonas sp. TWI1437]|uniref:beta-N-acetylhexosaminidase n=1 Tax=unclassified Luteimonas TaxID=2629088 RepID=UPI00320B7AF4
MPVRLIPRLPAVALGLAAAALLTACAPRPQRPHEVVAAPALIPAPARLVTGDGGFDLDAATPLHADSEAAQQAARRFAALAARSNGLRLAAPAAGGPAPGAIAFVLDPAVSPEAPEGYALAIGSDGIVVRASNARGLFHGATTLWQLIAQAQGEAMTLPALRIDDAPRFGWRGLMLDSARHFQSVDEIKRVLDAMAMHKLNVFHWHLTDDQGWRIEIKRYPRLAEVGGCRIPAGDGGIDPATGAPVPYCGYYTQDQVREIVAYAAALHIEVVPEINGPGHAQAAVSAYPELGVLDTPVPVLAEWGVNRTLFNVEESTFTFLENVLAEVVDLFPGRYVHVGGDEAVKDQWEASPRVQQRMRELGVRDEAQLQSHFIGRMERYLSTHGRRLIGWDEILEGGLPPEATVMSWRGIEGGIAAAALGHDVVMSPSSDLYLDYLQTDAPDEPPGRPSMVTLEQVYRFEPVPAALPAAQRHHILGVQANMWTEHTRSFARLQHNLFPRMAALAETAWSPAEARDYAGFLARLPMQLQRYRALDIAYAQTPFQALATIEGDRRDGTARVTLRNPLGYPIRYTLDGRAPDAGSPRYTAPLDVRLPAQVRAAAFATDGTPLAPATTHAVDATSLLTRHNAELAVCPDVGRLLLRLEDDGPLTGERAIFNVTIFHPCWLWPAADLGDIDRLTVRAGRMPYAFQLAHDEPQRTFLPARTAHGELQVQGEGCAGPVLATVPLPAAPDADGFVSLDVPLDTGALASRRTTDLCLRFTGDTRPTMWVVDAVTLQPR